jgi:hypothetical protein
MRYEALPHALQEMSDPTLPFRGIGENPMVDSQGKKMYGARDVE